MNLETYLAAGKQAISYEIYAPIGTVKPKDLKGKVIDFATGNPIVGVNIYVKEEKKTGTASRDNGEFYLTVNPNHTIVFSHQTYGVEEWNAKDVGATVYMAESANQLDEVVITNNPKTLNTPWLKYAGFGLLGLIILLGLTKKK